MTDTVTYRLRSGDRPMSQTWMAYVVMPNGQLWMVPSFGASEEEAVNKIVTLWESERAKFSANPVNWIKEPKPVDNPWGEPKQHHLAGLVWVIHKNTREKKRVKEVELPIMLLQGWERGGPRSK